MRYKRKVTQQLVDAMENGDVSAKTVAHACLGYMSEADVEDMCEIEGLLDIEEGVIYDEL